ncbi:MAG: hypothetical protein ACPG5P_08090, partial [Saprospiraceae bacterium]
MFSTNSKKILVLRVGHLQGVRHVIFPNVVLPLFIAKLLRVPLSYTAPHLYLSEIIFPTSRCVQD